MARRADDSPGEPVVELIDGDDPTTTFDDWLDSLALGEPTDLNVGAAEILREIREHGEH